MPQKLESPAIHQSVIKRALLFGKHAKGIPKVYCVALASPGCALAPTNNVSL